MFRKRRVKPSPNKNAAKVRRREHEASFPTLAEIYPTVGRLAVELRFFNNQGNPLGEKSLQFGPNDPVELLIPCSGLCGNGRMDLAGKLEDMVRNRSTTAQASGRCGQTLFAGSSESCGHELRARIEISYLPNSALA